MRSLGDEMLEAMTYRGRSRFKMAWLMFRASYAYTRSFDGSPGIVAGDTISFGRWESFKEAVETGWRYLWRKP